MYRALQCCELRLLIKRIKDFSIRGLFTYTPTCWQQNDHELEIFHNELGFRLVHTQISCSLCRKRVGVYVNKPLTSSHIVFLQKSPFWLPRQQ